MTPWKRFSGRRFPPCLILAALLLILAVPGPARADGGETFYLKLKNAPYPYNGKYADTQTDFFDFVDPATGARSHTNRYGQRFPEAAHYRDSSVLFHIPPGFNPAKPFSLTVFFHGHSSTHRETYRRYELGRQVDESGANTILIMPQLAKDATDSSPGKFFQSGLFSAFLDEAARGLAKRGSGPGEQAVRQAPVYLAAFSGGYKSIAYILDRGGLEERIRGILLLDALFEDEDKFISWLAGGNGKEILVSVYRHEGPCREYNRKLAMALIDMNRSYRIGWPDLQHSQGVYFLPVDTPHLEIPLKGPPWGPLGSFLAGMKP